jgi:methionine-rich copper-binding protein CopC
MRILKEIICSFILMMLGVQGAFAHTHLKSSDPVDGSELQVAPKQVTLTFGDPIQLTALDIVPEGGKPRTVQSLPGEVVKAVTVPLPPLKAGKYVIKWRAAGHDGHVMSGQLKFTIKTPEVK